MGSMKDEMMDQQEANRDRKLAEILGISYGELCEAEWEIDEMTNNDGLVTDVQVHFSEATPKAILEKIEGIGHDGRVSIGLNALD